MRCSEPGHRVQIAIVASRAPGLPRLRDWVVRPQFTPHNIMFKKSDIAFEEMAADPERRRVAIDDLSKRRTAMSWLVMLMLIVVFISIWSGKGPGTLYISAAFLYTALTRFESDLRLLRVIDRIHRDSDEKRKSS